ncbi:MAG TPA: AAA family ATPase [Pirellulales bacterium]|jgi:type II secretory pathway predicted ATPase ExeA
MYDAFFQLQERPFASMPQTERYAPIRAIEAARETLVRCVERAEGTGVLIGPSGSGKTLLCQLLRGHFQPTFAVALLGTARLDSPRSLLQTILFELSLPCRGMDDGELRLTLIDYLTDDAKSQRGVLLLVDEAHTLPSRVLEEVRLITNVSVGGRPRVRLMLAGCPLLEERLASPKLESFSQRTAARCYLEPLNRNETFEYIRAQLACCGGDATTIFAESALEAAYRASDGVPRLINQVCDHALVLAFSRGKRLLDDADVETAWADLQQLPTPWTQTPGAPAADDVIQFGQLDDELDEPLARSSLSNSSGDISEEFDSPQAAEHAPTNVRYAQDSERLRPQPMERLEEIERQISSIEVGYSRSPATATKRTDSSDPFAESFDEEEVVVDRFGMSHTAFWDQMPQVYSAEGQMLSTLLAPYVEVARPVQLGVVATYDAPASTSETIARSCATEIADKQLIVVEEDPAAPPKVRRPMSSAYRQEYSQLFAKLRQSL